MGPKQPYSTVLNMEGDKPQEKTFKSYPIVYFHIDIAKVRTEEGKLYLFVARDRTCKFAYAELYPEVIKTIAAQFPRHLIAAVPDKIHPVLTDTGIQFTNRKRDEYASNTSLQGSAMNMPLHTG
jgi:hypothetical protein